MKSRVELRLGGDIYTWREISKYSGAVKCNGRAANSTRLDSTSMVPNSN